SFARDGGGFSTSLLNYLKSPTFRETPPKLIIWEIPERVLQAAADTDRTSGTPQQ
ncbi:MAG: cell division protein FtsQ, partial [Burkholderiaceae bacterium]|nr:cell division protein FtsQ [Burkholderiaceae bacterium]